MKIISVIVPMYNVATYLHNCIKSVFEQGIAESDFEIIMVDDESPDNSLEIANALAKQYSNIIVVSQKNKGLGGARNTGVANASGEYILFLDADDWFIPNSIKNIYKIAKENKLDILEYGFNQVTKEGTVVNSLALNNNKIFKGVNYYNTIKYSGSACNKLYSRSFLKANNLVFLEKIYGEDFEFNTRAYFFANKVMATDIICSEFLQSDNSITRNKSKSMKTKYLNDYIKILDNIKTFYLENNTENKPEVTSYFKERLTLVNINAFFMMFKNKYSYKEILDYKKNLDAKKILYIKQTVANKKKNIFRRIMLQNFFLFRFSQPLIKLIK